MNTLINTTPPPPASPPALSRSPAVWIVFILCCCPLLPGLMLVAALYKSGLSPDTVVSIKLFSLPLFAAGLQLLRQRRSALPLFLLSLMLALLALTQRTGDAYVLDLGNLASFAAITAGIALSWRLFKPGVPWL